MNQKNDEQQDVDNWSISDVLLSAPRPNILAEDLLKHIQGEGKKKFSRGLFYNPGDETYDVFGYLCWMLGLVVEFDVADDGHVVNSGYCVAPDGSRELITRVCNTALGYNPRNSLTPMVTPYADDLIHLWSGVNAQLDENAQVQQDNLANDEIEKELHHRQIPYDLFKELQNISGGDRDPFPYQCFVPAQRLDHYAMKDQKS